MTPVLRLVDAQIPGRLNRSDLDVPGGEFVGVIGPNGGGKTSLLRVVAGIDGSARTLEIAGEKLSAAPPARKSQLLSYLPASRDVPWPISVRDTIALGLTAPDYGRVADLLGLLDLDGLAARPVNQLSTGERSRVLLARALATRPRLLLLDEPLSNLEPYWALRTLDVLAEQITSETAALVALHDLHQLDRFSRIIVMDKGSVLLDGAPAEVIGDPGFSTCFRVEEGAAGWAIKR
ncbi:ABC transporter ATP-binding protein [Sphingomonas piscis]|uniref:ABC transporter ATP-binding protein n=1 Tax=Sphingomonas piscis TaxID=2714943 RepID=A0A6G7YLF1_9SPHN|nr:ABC transporter ATP-binding protein [Sphingomonas piscis]QIK77573.1 ABC transporter ATP-binding protein [Sphingomonas piscis]